MRTRLTKADVILIALLVVATVGSFYAIGSLTTRGRTALVQVDGNTVRKMNLDESSIAEISGVQGKLTVEVRGGKVAITHSDCLNRICVRTGWRSRGGEIIVCVPNKVLVRILPENSVDVRAVTG
jgi:hypothetical protein